ncbi:PREDICTED: uncharacterized protein LOC109470886 isoform X2 [Branchiostoma belcheri]|uniref:Uncharacterized protein LOC109470886 isoform X2 n=1 Tax=Branchiostoma belcheri TaxID=7741 RepID=A0A6P4Z7C5_BRABE|nr:PREDICTED: uncharacterized protein LOC109470886 isoform X2 [Branchiostoma belcheri]
MAGKSVVTMVMTVSLVVLLRDQTGVSSAPAPAPEPKLTLDIVAAQLEDVDTRVVVLESRVTENQERAEEEKLAFLSRIGKVETDMQGTKGELARLKNMETKIQTLHQEQEALAADMATFEEKAEILEQVEPMLERVEGLENKVVSGAQLHEDPNSVGTAPSGSGFDIDAIMAQIQEALQSMVGNRGEPDGWSCERGIGTIGGRLPGEIWSVLPWDNLRDVNREDVPTLGQPDTKRALLHT